MKPEDVAGYIAAILAWTAVTAAVSAIITASNVNDGWHKQLVAKKLGTYTEEGRFIWLEKEQP